MTEGHLAEFLTGPWFAVLTDLDGYVYASVKDAEENAEFPEDGDFSVCVVRGTAAPQTGADDEMRLPGSYMPEDKAYELSDLSLHDDADHAESAEVRFAQAQAMAAGLNAAGGA